MDELTNRSRTYAEAVVTMVWLLLLAAALEGKCKVPGLDVPRNALVLAGPTIITGICPLLACCISKNKRAFCDVTALLSAAMLLSLACWIATFTVSMEYALEAVACMFLFFMVLPRTLSYCWQIHEQGHPERCKDFHTVLDGSHEFFCCMTGFHFLWLESLALEGFICKSHALSETMGIINIFCCAAGMFIVHLGMTPPVTWSTMAHIPGPFGGREIGMISTIGLVLVLSMSKLIGVIQWIIVLVVGPLIAAVIYYLGVQHVTSPKEAWDSQNTDPKLAPLGLTKLMVTGFLTISISVDSTRQLIKWFLLFAAVAILSGLVWRLLTQAQVRNTLENNNIPLVNFCAKTACFCAHSSVAIAAVLLMFEIFYVKQSMSAAAPAPAPACT